MLSQEVGRGAKEETAATTMGSERLDTSAPEFTLPGGLSSHTEPGTSTTRRESAPQPITSEEATASIPTLPIAPMNTLSMSLPAQQLPPLPNFIGDRLEEDGENFEQWLERLELIVTGTRGPSS